MRQIPPPSFTLSQVFNEIKTMQKDNLNEIVSQAKQQKGQQEVKGLKFIARKLKILLEKNRKIEYNDISRILVQNFASAQKDERNIKRRVYDAINVLVAAKVIKKQNNRIELNFNRKGEDEQQYMKRQKNRIEQAISEKEKLIRYRKEQIIILQRLKKTHKNKKGNKIENPSFMIFKGAPRSIKIRKSKKPLVQFKGVKSLFRNPLSIREFIKEC